MDHKTRRLLLPSYAIRLTMAFVLFSWIGWQFIVISLGYTRPQDSPKQTYFMEVGVMLLLYSVNLLLRLKRHEAEPSREAAQLFFGAGIIALPIATWLLHQYIKHEFVGPNKPLKYLSLGVSVAYFAMFVIWLQTTVDSYNHAKPDTLSYRIMRRLKAMFIEPYVRNE